jgi:hypothetical protein
VDLPNPDRSVEQETSTEGKGSPGSTTTLLVLTVLMLVAMVALTSVVIAR